MSETVVPAWRWRVRVNSDGGVIDEARVTYQVQGLSGDWVARAHAALTATGIPQPGDDPGGQGANLYVARREVSFAEEDASVAYVEVVYRTKGQEELSYTLHGGARMDHIETRVDRLGNEITVTHNGDTQGAAVSVRIPATSMQATGITQLAVGGIPLDIVFDWTGAINNAEWYGGAAGTWLITGVTFEPYDIANRRWRFTFHIQHNIDGHQPHVWYIDTETGHPPANLDDTGYGIVDWYPEANFNNLPF